MKKILLLFILLFLQSSYAQKKQLPDTVSVGVYINSLHNIDFKEKEYTISLWLWLKYRNPDFDFSKYLEVPMAKTVDKSFYTTDTLDDGRISMLMKLQCVMKDNWKIENFPFDKQKLRFTIENSQFDKNDLVFVYDSVGKNYSKWIVSGWNVNPKHFKISTGIKKYETTFGDTSIEKPLTEYSNFKIYIGLERDSWWLFLKLFLGMYISFLLSLVCFFIHRDSIDSRFGLSVGALFAVIGNKYVVDSTLPESTSFTLVDALHGLTLVFVFAVVACSAYSLRLIKSNKTPQAKRFDKISGYLLLLTYIIVNIVLVYQASIALPA